MYRVLVFGMTENPGGVESFLMNNYRKIDNNKIHLDFLANTKNKIAFEDELVSHGSKVYHISPRRKSPINFYRELNHFFSRLADEYDCIWVNLNTLVNIDYLKYAKKYGIKRRIVHAHNSRNMDEGLKGKLTYQFHEYHKNRIASYATDFWACSLDAAKWFYPKEVLSKVKVVKNAIEIKRFKFDAQKRRELRKSLNLDNKFVIGNVGRLHFQKNQEFIIDIINHLKEKDPDVRLLLVGQGPDERKLKEKINKLSLNDYVILVGVQNDIQKWLSAFDIFVFPSNFEGLGIAGLEAEANGLPVLASANVIPEELKINDNFEFLNLKSGPLNWAREIEKMNVTREKPNKIKQNFIEEGYDINVAVQRLQELLLKGRTNEK